MLDKIHRGYIEGYYGKLLSFEDRHKLLVCLENLSMDSYLYAPKEDICHRFDWRRPYRESWLNTFASFCADAQARQIQVLAGIAPGLDFNFAEDKADFAALLAKAHQMLAAGADALVLMFDDISDDISAFAEAGLSEGLAHARLANRLAFRPLGWPSGQAGQPASRLDSQSAGRPAGSRSMVSGVGRRSALNKIPMSTSGRRRGNFGSTPGRL